MAKKTRILDSVQIRGRNTGHPTVPRVKREEREVKGWVRDLKKKTGIAQLSITKRRSDRSPGLGLHILYPGDTKPTKHKTGAGLREWHKAFYELLDVLEARGIELPDEYRSDEDEDRPLVVTHDWSIRRAVDELLKEYRRRIQDGEYKERSFSDPMSRAAAIKSFEGAWKPIELLGMAQGKRWYRAYVKFRKAQGAGDSTITRELRFLDLVKRNAHTEGKFEGMTGPDLWKKVQTPVKGSRNRTLSWEQFVQLREALILKWRIVLTFSIHTGAEKSVCQNILVSDLEIDSGRVRLPGTKQRATSQKQGKPNHRDRWVYLSDDQFQVMEEILLARDEALRHEGIVPGRAGHLFPYFRDTGFATALRKACRSLGVERFTHHDCRHVFATWRLLAGHDQDRVSYELGESPDSKMLRGVYSQVTSEHILPPESVRPLAHGQEWKVLRKRAARSEEDAKGVLGQNWDKNEGPVLVGEPPQALEN